MLAGYRMNPLSLTISWMWHHCRGLVLFFCNYVLVDLSEFLKVTSISFLDSPSLDKLTEYTLHAFIL
jgi:hypothetical protein